MNTILCLMDQILYQMVSGLEHNLKELAILVMQKAQVRWE